MNTIVETHDLRIRTNSTENFTNLFKMATRVLTHLHTGFTLTGH